MPLLIKYYNNSLYLSRIACDNLKQVRINSLTTIDEFTKLQNQ